MGTIENIEDYKPHLTIQIANGDVHVMPLAMWQDFADGKLPLANIECGELLLRAIVSDWLQDVPLRR